ncbi:uncharacterized protein LOC109124331 [Vitis vinifera]|uniref:uncharacterized protein LOC109124331 n=1 Tax=Vitis vinifera TaxID=29760 RepID=UPI0008FED531|nr:uncharacterized protein LOC109124331 [Vitis vinifera]|eukprot:XP_019082000.1 PREDICTED: uncharacterized protein LOC109124331 [Vitis vinifera]
MLGGVTGGILVFWDNKVLELMGMELGLYSISCRFKCCDDCFVWIFSGEYGPTLGNAREDFWDEFGAIRGLWSDPWCIRGDFNVVRFPGEHSGASRLTSAMRRFTKVIDDLHLRNLPLLGGSSTWSEGLNNQAYLRLDRFLVSEGWEGHFSNVLQCVLPKPVSDHSPILLDVGGMRRGPSPFRFESMWLKEEGFKDLVKFWWLELSFRGFSSFILTEKLKKLKGFLKSWNFEVFGNVAIRKNLTLTQVGFWDSQELLGTLSIKEEIAKKASRVEFRKWALMEETSWRQKSREVWLKEGNRNTNFFSQNGKCMY